MLGGLLLADRFMWFTPFWLLAVGVGAALVVLLLTWGGISLASRRAGAWIKDVASEGLPLPLFIFGGLITLYAGIVLIAGLGLRKVKSFRSIRCRSLSRLLVSSAPTVQTISCTVGNQQRVSDRSVAGRSRVVLDQSRTRCPVPALLPGMAGYNEYFEMVFPLDAGKDWSWSRSIFKDKNNPIVGSLFQRRQIRFYVNNNTNLPNQVTASITATIEPPRWRSFMTAAWVIGGTLFTSAALGFPARHGRRRCDDEGNAQPTAVLHHPRRDVGLHLLSVVYPAQNTFGDDVKPFKDYLLTWLTVWPIFLAVWTASHSIADEIEAKRPSTLSASLSAASNLSWANTWA